MPFSFRSLSFFILCFVCIDLHADAARIVSANGTISEILVGLGLEKQIVGVDVTSTYPASLEKIPKIGHNRTIAAEGILALNPDVIIYTNQSMIPPAVVNSSAVPAKNWSNSSMNIRKKGQ